MTKQEIEDMIAEALEDAFKEGERCERGRYSCYDEKKEAKELAEKIMEEKENG